MQKCLSTQEYMMTSGFFLEAGENSKHDLLYNCGNTLLKELYLLKVLSDPEECGEAQAQTNLYSSCYLWLVIALNSKH